MHSFKSLKHVYGDAETVNTLVQRVIGRIVNYHIGIRAQMSRECLIQFEKFSSVALAGQLIGRKVIWQKGNSRHGGKVVGLHGKKGMVRVRFTRGVPGQALGTTVELAS
jgi:large subunit ribosomal protein L35Ae